MHRGCSGRAGRQGRAGGAAQMRAKSRIVFVAGRALKGAGVVGYTISRGASGGGPRGLRATRGGCTVARNSACRWWCALTRLSASNFISVAVGRLPLEACDRPASGADRLSLIHAAFHADIVYN